MLPQLKQTTFISFTLVCLCFTQWVISASNYSELASVFAKSVGPTTLGELFKGISTDGNLNNTCFDARNGYSNLVSCLESQCITKDEVARLFRLSLDTELDTQALREVAPAVVYTLNQRSSCGDGSDNATLTQRPSASAVWGYSFLMVTLINLCSLTGIMVLPCMKSSMYKVILMFMVALAVGTLVGSGVLVLIPEAFELSSVGRSKEGGSSHDYIWTSTSIIGGIYLFFLIERIMRMINTWRENTKDLKRRDEMATQGTLTSSFSRQTPHNASLRMKDPATVHLDPSPSSSCLCNVELDVPEGRGEQNSNNSSENGARSETEEGYGGKKGDDGEGDVGGSLIKKNLTATLNGHSHGSAGHNHNGQVAPVAYMVIFGDGLHNFIDGLSIGAAFTDSILLGISVSVAVMCEELPHELGDFAILLNAGMRLRKALMYNFLSSLMCYFGLVVGILVGEHTAAHTWIFGIAGGMFLYISLVDMMPEMNSAADSEEGKRLGMMRTFLIQNVGLILGYTVILLMARFGGDISFE
ncbi:metal cation symporter ZIP14-like [Littorina saxatilis]